MDVVIRPKVCKNFQQIPFSYNITARIFLISHRIDATRVYKQK